MKVLVCGGRDYSDRTVVAKALDALHAKHGVDLVIHGDATGADRLARDWAIERGIIQCAVPAPWKFHGNPAGPMRNKAMLTLSPDCCVAFPGGRGTAGMCELAAEAGVLVWRVGGAT